MPEETRETHEFGWFLPRKYGASFGLDLDYAVILVATVILVLIGARLYPQLGV